MLVALCRCVVALLVANLMTQPGDAVERQPGQDMDHYTSLIARMCSTQASPVAWLEMECLACMFWVGVSRTISQEAEHQGTWHGAQTH